MKAADLDAERRMPMGMEGERPAMEDVNQV